MGIFASSGFLPLALKATMLPLAQAQARMMMQQSAYNLGMPGMAPGMMMPGMMVPGMPGMMGFEDQVSAVSPRIK